MSEQGAPRVCEILLVEDNPADARLTREARSESQMLNRLHHVKGGIEALQFLRREDGFQDAPMPDVMLLDLNLPRKDGRQVLSEMKQDPRLRMIPVVILTAKELDAAELLKLRKVGATVLAKGRGDAERVVDAVLASVLPGKRHQTAEAIA